MVEVKHDGTGRFDPMEHCCLCREKTRFWYEEKDVALCVKCAETAIHNKIPSKKEWIEKENEIERQSRRRITQGDTK